MDLDQLTSQKPADLDLQCFQNKIYPVLKTVLDELNELTIKQILVIHLVLSGDISWFSMVMVKSHTPFDLTARVLNLILKVPATKNAVCFVS